MSQSPIDVLQLQKRKSVEWAALYDSMSRATYRLIARLTGANQADVEELSQETWLDAITSIDTFNPERGSVEGWILGIARNKALLHLRKAYKAESKTAYANARLRERRSLEEVPTIEESNKNARIALLRAAIELLPDRWQSIMRSKYFEGLKVEEIANRTNSTPKSIESVLSRARLRLRTLYQDSLIFSEDDR